MNESEFGELIRWGERLRAEQALRKRCARTAMQHERMAALIEEIAKATNAMATLVAPKADGTG